MPSADCSVRFERLVARKEAAARDAAIAAFITDADRPDAALVAMGNAWSRTIFDGPFYLSAALSLDLPATSLVFVQSRDGNTGATDPASLGGGEADKHLIYEGLSRVAADAVLAGAETVRSGNIVLSTWRPELVELRRSLGLPRHPIQIVATLRGLQLDDGLLFNVPELRVILLTLPACSELMRTQLADRPWVMPIAMPTPHELRFAFRQLRELGIQRISCIGGRTIAEQLIDAGLIQDVYLTTAPQPGGEPNTPFYSKPLPAREVVRKHGSGQDTGVIFQHLVLS